MYMNVFRQVAVLGLLIFLGRPAGVDASSITITAAGGGPSNVDGTACTFAGATGACSSFDIHQIDTVVPGAVSIAGLFQFDNDIALFGFSVNSDVLFTATTSSFTRDANGDPDGGFDPLLGLYNAAGALVPYTPAGDPVNCGGGLACIDDISDTDFNAQIANLLLTPGNYFLALTQTVNFPHEQLEDLLGGFDQAAPELACYWSGLAAGECTAGAPGMFQGLSGNFALELQVDPVATAVPEPGTLALLGTGLVTAIARRRARKSCKK
jgi:hypothetical protein